MKIFVPTVFAKSILSIVALFAAILISAEKSKAQGCVAVRHMSSCGNPNAANTNTNLMAGQWQVSASYRYFRSFRHFRGTHEEKERLEKGNEVINTTNALDLGVTYALTNRLSFSAVVPLSYTDRSSWYEHVDRNKGPRYHSQAYGLGDIRLQTSYWLIDSEKYMDGNIAVGAGVKLPTGNFNTQDEFHIKRNDQVVLERRPVDQSLQLGDGGVAGLLEIQAYHKLFKNATAYISGFYMINARDTTKTRTYRETLNATLANESYLSVPDQFSARAGINYAVFPSKGIYVSVGGRFEGVPVRDLIGKSNGFRRPGHIFSVEPGITYAHGKNIVTLGVPVALIRNRTKSVTDRQMNRHGDAAFADYLVFLNYAHRF
jgi:hypothetical protein